MARRIATALIVLIGAFAIGEGVARACGDKFLTWGSSAFSRTFSSDHPSNVLIVKRTGDLAINSYELQASLEDAGHTVKVIDSPAALAKELSKRPKNPYDAVLMDLADAKSNAAQVASAAGQPLLVTVLSETTAAALAASQDYACLRTPDKAVNVLKMFDMLLAQRKATRQTHGTR